MSHALALATVLLLAPAAAAQQPSPQTPATPATAEPAKAAPSKTGPSKTGPSKTGPSMERLSGVWIEGPGFNITYGVAYDACAAKCLATTKCVMIEYYRPEKKCNMYDAERPRLKGGSSDVALKRP